MMVGSPLRIAIAGLEVEFEPRIEGLACRLNKHYEAFRSNQGRRDLRIRIDAGCKADRAADSFLFKCSTWAVHGLSAGYVFETYQPVFSRLIARADANKNFSEYALRFNDPFLNWYCARYGISKDSVMTLSHPLEQAIFLPVLARKDAFLVHACGAVLDGKAFVLAGHSGDGKTTLSRILGEEGLELLSDERVAIRKSGGEFTVYGTPWPGEGSIISAASYPLGGVFLLRKASRHRLVRQRSSTVAAELLSRSLVPYYLSYETKNIVELVTDITDSIPAGVLEFSPSCGIVPILSRAA